MAESAEITVFRFDPSIDDEPTYTTYEFPIADTEQTWNVLKALRWINVNVEPISFDFNCRYGYCGRCGVCVDGKPQLACWSKVEPGKSYLVEPLSGFPVVKDLVVDNSRARDRFVRSELQMKTYAPVEEIKTVDPDLWWGPEETGMAAKDFDSCRECMCCYSGCQALNAFEKWSTYIGPGAMMQIAARHYDTTDDSDRLSQAVFSGLFECVGCGTCETNCPAQIKIYTVIKKMQDEAIAAGIAKEDAKPTANWPAL